VVGRSAEVGRVVGLAGEEASRFGHRYVGPEHLLLGMLRDSDGGAARILQAQGVDLEAARAALGRLAARGVVPGPRPSDAELLGTLGIELEAVRRDAERAFGAQVLGWAIREATRARRRGVGRVARTPLQGPPMLAAHALMLARERARALGQEEAIGSELLLLGVVDDLTTRPPRCMSSRWTRRLHASVGLPERYRGAVGPLLAALGVDPERLRDAAVAALGETVP
jgi:Clp amino terminal domain, pathogenicity island component